MAIIRLLPLFPQILFWCLLLISSALQISKMRSMLYNYIKGDLFFIFGGKCHSKLFLIFNVLWHLNRKTFSVFIAPIMKNNILVTLALAFFLAGTCIPV